MFLLGGAGALAAIAVSAALWSLEVTRFKSVQRELQERYVARVLLIAETAGDLLDHNSAISVTERYLGRAAEFNRIVDLSVTSPLQGLVPLIGIRSPQAVGTRSVLPVEMPASDERATDSLYIPEQQALVVWTTVHSERYPGARLRAVYDVSGESFSGSASWQHMAAMTLVPASLSIAVILILLAPQLRGLRRLQRALASFPLAGAPLDIRAPRGAAHDVRFLHSLVRRASQHSARQIERLQLQAARQEAVVRHAYHPVMLLDHQGRIIGANEATHVVFGWPRDRTRGYPVSGFLPPEEVGRLESLLDRLAGPAVTGEVRRELLELTVTGPATLFPCEVAAVGFTLGQGRFVSMAFRDLTSLKIASDRAERARQLAEEANRAKSLFLANMSHEIRTPMNGIIGMAELAWRSSKDDEQREQLAVVRSCAQQLLSLVNDVLDLSKIEAGRMQVDAVSFSPSDLAAKVIATYQPVAQRKQLKLALEVDPIVPDQLVSDPLRLRQILNNLVDNALKFTMSGEVIVNLSSRPHPADVQRLELVVSVRDTGIGIPREKHAEVFDLFSQADGSTTRKFGGTGLGLSLSRTLAQLLGGDLVLDSEPGRGSTFTFWIICREADGNAPDFQDTTPVDAEYQAPDLQGKRILLAEDTRTNVILIRRLLQPLGATIEWVENGAEAVRVAGERDFDLILMDVSMPILGGFEATGMIRRREVRDESPRIPIIGLTAFAMQGDRERCLEAGMDDYLAKPFDGRRLIDKVARAIGAAREDT